MIITELFLTSFGKFKNKSIILKYGLNIIYGDNEAGKTTIHKFIEGMIFGFFKPYSKKKIYSEDYDRFLPWDYSDYGGILKYTIDENTYRIERNFLKGNDEVKIFDENTGEDISHIFEYDNVTRLHQPMTFIGLNSTVFNNTISISQAKSKSEEALSKEVKDSLINLGGSLDEDISIKKVLEKLDEKIHNIGTEKRIKTSPLGKIVEEIEKLEKEKEKALSISMEVKEYQEKANYLSEKTNLLKKKKSYIENKLELLDIYNAAQKYEKSLKLLEEINELKVQLDEYEENTDINCDNSKKEDPIYNNQNINEKLYKYEELEDEKNKLLYNNEYNSLLFLNTRAEEKLRSLRKINMIKIASIIGIILSLLLGFWVTKTLYYFSSFPLIVLVYSFISSVELKKYINNIKQQILDMDEKDKSRKLSIEEIEKDMEDILKIFKCKSKVELRKLAIQMAEKNHNANEELEKKKSYERLSQLLESKKSLYNNILGQNKIEYLKKKAEDFNEQMTENIVDLNKEILLDELSNINDIILETKNELTRLEEKIRFLSSLTTELVQIEEELIRKKNIQNEYESKREALVIAKNTIDKISKNIQRDFAPKLNSKVGVIIQSVTSNKYSDVKITENLNIKVIDPTTNKLIDVEKLSCGTIDQLYFAMRLGIVDIIKGKNNLPLILDDSFVQYDYPRLENILEFLSKESLKRQIILFTCHKREKEILNKQGVNYNLVNL